MKKKILAALSLMLAFALAVTPSVEVSAAENSEAGATDIDEVTEDTTSEVEVKVVVASEFTVKIPKKIVLSGETKNGEYQVFVKGDIGGTEVVSITAPAEFDLTQDGKDPIKATNAMAKTEWSFDEINTVDYTASGVNTITADTATAGLWNGIISFVIQLKTDDDYKWDSYVAAGDITVVGTEITEVDETAVEGEIKIPIGITSIADNAFADCANITKVIIPTSMAKIGDAAFSGCTSLSVIEYTGIEFPNASLFMTYVGEAMDIAPGYWPSN